MNILELCDRTTAVVPRDATVAEAIRVMLAHHVGATAVVNDRGQIVGIFTERDVLMKVALSGRNPAGTPVTEVMTSPVQTASRQISPGEALAAMMQEHFRHIPIVDSEEKLLGILSIRNLLQWRTEDLSHELDALEQYYTNDSLGG